jgi:hypothetical protein
VGGERWGEMGNEVLGVGLFEGVLAVGEHKDLRILHRYKRENADYTPC